MNIEEFKQSITPRHMKLDNTEEFERGDVILTCEGQEYIIMDVLNYNDIFVIEYGVLH